MRKLLLLAAVALATAFSAQSNVAVAQSGQSLNPNTDKFMQDGMNPYGATSKAAAPAKAAKKGKKGKKKMSKKK